MSRKVNFRHYGDVRCTVTNGQEIQNRAVQSASCGPSAIFLASHQAKNEVKQPDLTQIQISNIYSLYKTCALPCHDHSHINTEPHQHFIKYCQLWWCHPFPLSFCHKAVVNRIKFQTLWWLGHGSLD